MKLGLTDRPSARSSESAIQTEQDGLENSLKLVWHYKLLELLTYSAQIRVVGHLLVTVSHLHALGSQQ